MSTEKPALEEVELQLQRGVFGYRREQVDKALDAAEAERAALKLELNAAQVEIERLREIVAERESQADDTRAELVYARQHLEQDRQAMLHEKEMILEAAHQLAEEIQSRAQRRVTEEGWELHRARIERQRFVENFRGLLLRYLEEIDRLSTGGAAGSSPQTAVAEIPPEVFSAAADRLFVPPGFEAPETAAKKPVQERFSS